MFKVRVAVQKAIFKSLKMGTVPNVLSLMVSKPKTQLKIETILNIGIVMRGKFPEIFWEMDLTSTELRILHYVYDNVLRIYSALTYYPRGKDDTPRFWRSKEKMAAECKVSPTAFRTGVRHLAELGLVTSMDSAQEGDNAEYCIGLSTNFIDRSFIETQIENVSAEERYNNLARYLYSRESISYLRIESDTPFKKFAEHEEEMITAIRARFSWNERKRVTITGIRVPMHYQPVVGGLRLNVELPKTMVELVREELKKYEYVLNAEEQKIMNVKKYYEYKVRKALDISGFCCMSTKRPEWRKNKKWKWLTRLYKQCDENGWDYQVFIDAQFDRLTWFKRPQKYVYLNQFFSDGAIKYYYRYMDNYQRCHYLTGKGKVVTSTVQSISMDVVNAVVNDCENISKFIQSARKYPAYRGLAPEEIKVMYFSQNWTSMSKYYLAEIPWFRDWLYRSSATSNTTKELVTSIDKLQKSPTMMSRIHRIVAETERRLDLPKTMTLENS